MRALVLAAALTAVAAAASVASAACGSSPAHIALARGASAATHLSVAVYPRGSAGGHVRHYRVACGPPRGTVAHPDRACRELARSSRPFAPVPVGKICSTISLGPQVALVTGLLRGATVNARLTVRNSCQIQRWRALRDVAPGFPGR
jgi:hypothetical protein